MVRMHADVPWYWWLVSHELLDGRCERGRWKEILGIELLE